MLPQSSHQDIQYFLVINFKSTCDSEKNNEPQEIIEFSSVIVNSINGKSEGYFQTYVRPTYNKLLTDFCKDLTGIQQNDIDNGVTLSEALLRHDYCLQSKGIKNSNLAVVTWSNRDCGTILELECRYKNIKKPSYFNRWINLRVPFNDVFGGSRCSLKEAVEKAGLEWEDLDKAKNAARLLALFINMRFKFSFTNAFDVSRKSYYVLSNLSEGPLQENIPFCYCGIKSKLRTIKKYDPKMGKVFFGCGNWTADGGARCEYFEWPSPSILENLIYVYC